jgi:hypothetical protein
MNAMDYIGVASMWILSHLNAVCMRLVDPKSCQLNSTFHISNLKDSLIPPKLLAPASVFC